MSNISDSFSEEELKLLADEIEKDLLTQPNLDPVDSSSLNFKSESETDDDIFINKFPSLSLSGNNDINIDKNYARPFMSPTIVSYNRCHLSPHDSIQSLPPIPCEQNEKTSKNKYKKAVQCKRESLRPRLTLYDPPPMNIDLSVETCDSISSIVSVSSTDISSQISPRPKYPIRRRANSQIPDFTEYHMQYSQKNNYKKQKKHKNKRKKHKKNKSAQHDSLKLVKSPIFIRVDRSPTRLSQNKIKNISMDNEYAIEFEDEIIFFESE